MKGWWLFEGGAGFEGDRIGVTLRGDGLEFEGCDRLHVENRELGDSIAGVLTEVRWLEANDYGVFWDALVG